MHIANNGTRGVVVNSASIDYFIPIQPCKYTKKAIYIGKGKILKVPIITFLYIFKGENNCSKLRYR